MPGCVTSISNYQWDNSTLPVTVAASDLFNFPITVRLLFPSIHDWFKQDLLQVHANFAKCDLTQAAIDEGETIDNVQILPRSEVGELDID